MSKGGGNAPQPVDPYAQAGAQYGLSTGTAAFNAALNRPNISNPLGSTTWDVTGYSGGIPQGAYGGSGGAYGGGAGGFPLADSYYPNGKPVATVGGGYGLGGGGLGAGAPRYTQSTQLAPQFQSLLEQPIDTSQVPGMPGGPSLEQNVAGSQNAAFNQQMGLLAPYEQHQIDTTKAQLAAEGATPGSAAYDWGMKGLGLMLGPENAQVANQAYLTGINTLPTLYGLGSTSLQNQILARNAPINEFQALQPGGGAAISAQTPDILGPFAQQYQGQLAGFNANQASQNATMGDLSQLGSAALMYYALSGALAASDRRVKTDIKRVGSMKTGEGVYTFRYKGEPEPARHMGVMAQEIERSKPEAVFNLGGTKFVNYGAI